MDISREIALEVFGLKENFAKEEVSKNFRRLSKIAHPDTGGDENLFKFIMCCKEALLDDSKSFSVKQTHKETKCDTSKKACNKASVNIDLATLYDIYYQFDYYMSKYNILYIQGTARIFITPCRNKKCCESKIIKFWQNFKEFRELNFANFSTTVNIPDDLKKFKKFEVRVEFMGETFEFKLSMKKPVHIVKYKLWKFNSIIELTFE